MEIAEPNMLRVREALESSWGRETAFQGAFQPGMPALGQCYPTSRALQLLYPSLEIVEGTVWTGGATEKHFWNLLSADSMEYHLDLTWQQFPSGSVVREWRVRDRGHLDDGPVTVARIELLMKRVKEHLDKD